MSFSDTLALFMDRYGYNNSTLAIRLGCNRMTIRKWLSGDSRPYAKGTLAWKLLRLMKETHV